MGVVSTTALSCGPAHQVWSPFGFPTPSRPPSFGRPVRSDRTDANTSHPPWNPNTTGFWLRKTDMVETSVFFPKGPGFYERMYTISTHAAKNHLSPRTPLSWTPFLTPPNPINPQTPLLAPLPEGHAPD